MKLILKTIIGFLFFINTANAQHDHSSHDHGGSVEHEHKAEPPHGGELKDIGKYHLEIVFDVMASTDKMSIYILKSNLNTLDAKDAKGTINVKHNDGKEEILELQNNGNDKLFCDLADAINGFNAVIKINYKGKDYSCAYYYKGMK